MKLISCGIFFATASLIAGCSSPLLYTPPVEGPVATLFLRGAPEAMVPGTALPATGQNTTFNTVTDTTTCRETAVLFNRMKSSEVKRVDISAGKPAVIRYFYGQFLPLFVCQGFIEFLPESGKTYSLGFDERRFKVGQCSPILQHQVDAAGHYVDTPFNRVCLATK